ncbi:hypothetical protein PTTG_25517 [Puccinia triticina 1-1 BBBD Race 1]|uniref:Uncharacterized protein n=1 Tax=Puccinia triticina (isolate 1-1 / race 1 (BBBD)) TaxID=630390 RepID=A0A180H174_PUCT1|nr:hypothetical protein PTTG_25517 [Puccinia triticina 1-1 BBBD Race 1]
MSYENPIIVPNDSPQTLSRAADDVDIARLLAPNGFPTIVGECYSQTKLDVVTEVVLVLIRKYCPNTFHAPTLNKKITSNCTARFATASRCRASLDGQDANQDIMMEPSNSSNS